MTNSKKIVAGVLIGAAVGTVLGILFAPKKGVKTRALIADKARNVGSTVNSSYNKAKDMLGVTHAKEEVTMN